MTRPVLLDLFCCAGGAAVGYDLAGFDVIGVDIDPQPNYLFRFIQGDAIDVLEEVARNGYIGWSGRRRVVEAIHASPPCQGYSDLKHRTGKEYPMLVEPVRELLLEAGLPYVIENVEGAPLDNPLVLCGTMFPALRVLRHRLFESNVDLKAPRPCQKPHPLVFTHDKRKAHYGRLNQDTSYVQVTGGGNCSIANAKAAMGIDWMTKNELNEAIPPAYTHWVGTFLRAEVERRRMMEVADVAA